MCLCLDVYVRVSKKCCPCAKENDIWMINSSEPSEKLMLEQKL